MCTLRPKEALDRASRCLEQGALKEAAELCSTVLGGAPRNARALYLRAAVLKSEGKGHEAAEAACEAARLRPDLPPLQLAAGSLLHREKRYALALELYERAIEEDPGIAHYHLGAASALRKLGRADEATAALHEAAAAAATAAADGSPPEAVGVQAQVQYKLGQHLRSTGDPSSCARAAAAYERCLELDPGHSLAAFWLAATRRFTASGEDGEVSVSGPRPGPDAEVGNDHAASSNGCHDSRGRNGVHVTPPSAAPREYVVGLYNAYAETFDSHLQGALGYRTPTVIVESLAVLFPGRRYRRCLDLGCGTGLSGQAASFACDRLVGVDLSPAMVGRAREKRVYHRLLVGDVTETVERLCSESSRTSPPGRDGTASEAPSQRGWETPEIAEEDGGAPAAPAWCEGSKATRPAPPTPPPPAAAEGGASLGGATTATAATPPVSGNGSGSGSGGDVGTGLGDLVISCDVFGYIGDLRACFEAVHELVAGGGCRSSSMADPGPAPQRPTDEHAAIFAFSAEAPPSVSAVVDGTAGKEMGDSGVGGGMAESRPGYELQGTGRYSHSREYLETICRDAGFRVLRVDSVILRKNAGVPVRGFIFITEAVPL